MLFRYDDGCHDSLSNRTPRPVAVRMVDFQISRIGNPTSDVLYFLYSSTRAETRKEHMIEWLQLYYDVLTGDLELLDVPNQGYTFDKFMKECRERSEMWMLYGGMVMGMVLNKKVVDSLNDMDEEMQKEPKQGKQLCKLKCKLNVTILPSYRKRRRERKRRQWIKRRVGGQNEEHDEIKQAK